MARALRQPGDAHPGVRLVLAVQVEEHRRQRFQGDAVPEHAGVEPPQAQVADEPEDGALRRLVVAAHEDVAVDRVIGVPEVRRRDVVEPGHDAHAGPEQRLCLERGRAALRQVDLADLGGLERHGDVEEDPPGERIHEAAQRLRVGGVGDGQDRDLAGPGGVLVRAALDPVAELARLLLGPRGVARADDDRVPGAGPAEREPAPLAADAADDSDAHPILQRPRGYATRRPWTRRNRSTLASAACAARPGSSSSRCRGSPWWPRGTTWAPSSPRG